MFPSSTFVRYKKEFDDPSQTAEVCCQRAAPLDDNTGTDKENEVPFKISPSGQVMSQASGTLYGYRGMQLTYR